MSWSLRLTLDLGLDYERLAVRFWDQVADNAPRLPPPATEPPAPGG